MKIQDFIMDLTFKKVWKWFKIATALMITFYFASYTVLSLSGKYYNSWRISGEYDVWGAWGCQTAGKYKGADAVYLTELGVFYLPLVLLDSRYWHKTKQTYTVQGDGYYIE